MGGAVEGGGVEGEAVSKSPRTWSLVCHANCSDAIECGAREQKVHRTPAIHMQSLSELSPSYIHPPHTHTPTPSFFSGRRNRYMFINGHTLDGGYGASSMCRL